VDDCDASDLALSELTTWEGLRAYGVLPGVELIDSDSVRAVFSRVPYEGFNALFLSTPRELSRLNESLAAAEGARVPLLAHLWTKPDDAETHILSAGFRFYEEEPAMVASLESSPSPQRTEGLSISPVRNEDELVSWITVLTGSADAAFIDEVARLRNVVTEEHEPAFEHLLGTIDGEIVACAAVFGGTRAAEVQHVVTDVRFRQRGIGTAMTTAAMNAAVTRGYSRAVLTASPDGAEIYRRLGFQTCGTVRRYIRLPDV